MTDVLAIPAGRTMETFVRHGGRVATRRYWPNTRQLRSRTAALDGEGERHGSDVGTDRSDGDPVVGAGRDPGDRGDRDVDPRERGGRRGPHHRRAARRPGWS